MATKPRGTAATVPTTASIPSLDAADLASTHPTVDADPPVDAAEARTAIEFNDPHLSGQEAVARNLKAEG